jgi:hypothetical protein
LLESFTRRRRFGTLLLKREIGQLLNNSRGNLETIPAFLVSLSECVSKILLGREIEQEIAI